MARKVAGIDGVKAVQEMLKQAPDHAYKVSRTALARSVTIVRKRLREKAKDIADTGTYYRSVGSVIKSNAKYKRNGVVFAAVGPQKDYFEHHTDKTADSPTSKKGLDRSLRRPHKYAHLVEWGTRHSRPQYIQTLAFTETDSQAIGAYIREVPKALIKRMAKDGKKKR